MTTQPINLPRPRAGEGARLVRANLAALDDLGSETLVAFAFSDVRPLAGALGFLDWRLSGAISEAFVDGILHGERGEVTLMPTRGRLGRRRLFIVGLGKCAECTDEVLREAWTRAAETVSRAGGAAPTLLAPAAGQARPGEASNRNDLERRFADLMHASASTGLGITAVLGESF